MSITERQKQVMNVIRDFQTRHGYGPTVREICRIMGLASPGSLFKHLRRLEDEGFLNRTPGKNRTWTIPGPSPGPSMGKSIPLLGRIAAGAPILAEENREADLPVDPALFGCDETFALTVRGDSMIEAHITDGDLAIIRPQEQVENGQIAAVLIEDMEPEATLKVFRKTKNRIELHAANPAYDPIVFEGAEREKVTVLGKLVGVIRSRANPGKMFPCVGRGFFA
jgi:repressor LexA